MSFLRCTGSMPCALRSPIFQGILPLRTQARHSVPRRSFHSASALWAIKSQVLKDVGEGITEVQIIQWYVEEGARIEEWKPLCQYQSDKAVDDITSRYEGVIKKLHFQADDTVPTGRALCDIEVEDGKYPDDGAPTAKNETVQVPADTETTRSHEATEHLVSESQVSNGVRKSRYASLATPAVRGLLKSYNLNILDIDGTGKDGRVLKEDVLRFVAEKESATQEIPSRPSATLDTRQSETTVNLTPIQSQMFKTMTRSLTIPHFLYTDEVKLNTLSAIRERLANDANDPKKVRLLPFVIKAVSLALNEYPLLNAKVDMTNPEAPKLIMRAKHNIGIAMDTPRGLIVPNIKDVANRSIVDIVSEISRLSGLGKAGKLTAADLNGGTITISNIGNIGGTYVAPVIVSNEVAILGIGRSKVVPVFGAAGEITKSELVNFSWSADHRVVDGATMARMANRVREFIESPELMLLNLR